MSDHASQNRARAMLRSALGPTIGAALQDPSVTDILVNPDGAIWIDRHGSGRVDSGARLDPNDAERVVRLAASAAGRDCHPGAPIVSAELPDGERFEGLVPPVAARPCFAIRKPAATLFRLGDYVAAGTMSAAEGAFLRRAVAARRSILVAGGTGSGKTTLLNALLAEVAETGDRVVILEDTRELRCAAADCVSLRTQPGAASLRDLVRSTLRLRPDRIIIGEVRGGEALDMLKAWNTGHAGGLTTIHANSAAAALLRLEQLVGEVAPHPPRGLIAEAIDLLIHLEGRGAARRVTALLRVAGAAPDGGYRLSPALSESA